MSWLSELKQEAQSSNENAREEHLAKASFLEQIQPQMTLLARFVADLAEQLNSVAPRVKHDYDLAGYAQLKGLQQSKYKYEVQERAGVIRATTFGFDCVGENILQFWVDTHDECVQARDRLFEHNLHFRWKDDAGWRYVFSIQPQVPVTFTFEPIASEGIVRLTSRNFERLGVVTYAFTPDQLSKLLLEELGKRIIGRENRFDEMSGYRVDEDIRAKFKEKIAERQRERQAELEPEVALGVTQTKLNLGRLFKKTDSPVNTDKSKRTTDEQKSQSAKRPGEHKKYAWMITGDDNGETTSELVSRLGPGMEYHAGINNLINRGLHFRLLDERARVRYTGYIVGEFAGKEPLVEYGVEHQCVAIEYERDGAWLSV